MAKIKKGCPKRLGPFLQCGNAARSRVNFLHLAQSEPEGRIALHELYDQDLSDGAAHLPVLSLCFLRGSNAVWRGLWRQVLSSSQGLGSAVESAHHSCDLTGLSAGVCPPVHWKRQAHHVWLQQTGALRATDGARDGSAGAFPACSKKRSEAGPTSCCSLQGAPSSFASCPWRLALGIWGRPGELLPTCSATNSKFLYALSCSQALRSMSPTVQPWVPARPGLGMTEKRVHGIPKSQACFVGCRWPFFGDVVEAVCPAGNTAPQQISSAECTS